MIQIARPLSAGEMQTVAVHSSAVRWKSRVTGVERKSAPKTRAGVNGPGVLEEVAPHVHVRRRLSVVIDLVAVAGTPVGDGGQTLPPAGVDFHDVPGHNGIGSQGRQRAGCERPHERRRQRAASRSRARASTVLICSSSGASCSASVSAVMASS